MVPPVKKEMHIEVIRICLALEEAGGCSAFLNGYVRKVELTYSSLNSGTCIKIMEWVKTTGSERQGLVKWIPYGPIYDSFLESF